MFGLSDLCAFARAYSLENDSMSKIRIAMIGTGGIAGKHAGTFLNRPDDVEIVGLVDVSDTVTAAFMQRLNFAKYNVNPPTFTDHETMYATVKPDAIVICTPHTLHFQEGMQALGHGCHVLMEKPMVTDAGDAYTLAAKVKETGKILVVGYNTPCSPEFQYLRNLVRTEELGKLELVSGWLSQGWMKGTTGKWRQDPKLSGGGQAYDSGAHPLCSLTWTIESRVAEVFAFVDNHGTPVDINSVISIKFENGVYASMTISGNCPTDGSAMVFIFENGKVEVDPWSASYIRVWKGRQQVKYPPVTGEPTQPADNFIEAIQGKTDPRTTPENGIVHSELMDAIYESQRTGAVARPKHRT